MKNLFTLTAFCFLISCSPAVIRAQQVVLTYDSQPFYCGSNAETINFGTTVFTTSYGYYKQACDAQDDSFSVVKFHNDRKFCNPSEFLTVLNQFTAANTSPQQRTMGRWIFCQDGNIKRFDSLKNAMHNSDFEITSTYKLNAKGDSVTVTTKIKALINYYGGLNYIGLITDAGKTINGKVIDKDYFRKTIGGAAGIPVGALNKGATKTIITKCSIDRVQNNYTWSPTFNVIVLLEDLTYPTWTYYRNIPIAYKSKLQ